MFFVLIFPFLECVDEKGGAAGILLESLRACNHDVRLRAAQHIVIMGEGAVISAMCVLCLCLFLVLVIFLFCTGAAKFVEDAFIG